MSVDIEATIKALSAEAIAGLLNKRDLTASARKELQRVGLLFPRTADKTPLGRDVFHRVRAIETRYE